MQEFDDRLSTEFPQAGSRDDLLQMRRFAVILKNYSDKHIRAYAIVWSVDEDGAPENSRDMRTQWIEPHCIRQNTGHTVRAGSSRLVSPFFNVSAEELGRRPWVVPQHFLRNKPLQKTTVKSVRLEAAIFSDGGVEGPDTQAMRTQYVARRNAEHDEAISVLRAVRAASGTWSPEQLNALFDAHVERGRSSSGTAATDLWWSARGQEASRLKSRLASGGVETLKNCVQRRANYPRANPQQTT